MPNRWLRSKKQHLWNTVNIYNFIHPKVADKKNSIKLVTICNDNIARNTTQIIIIIITTTTTIFYPR